MHPGLWKCVFNPPFHALSMGSDYSFYSVKQVHNLLAEGETDNLVYCILSRGSFAAPICFPCICLILFICTRMEGNCN